MSESSQTTLHVFALDSDEPIVGKAIAAFEKSLATDILAILKEQGVTWDTCSLDRCGKDMKTLDNSPPTILVSTSDINQHAWGTVRTKAKAAVSAAGVSVPFEVIPSTLSLLVYGKDQENWGARLRITRPLEMGASISMPGQGAGTTGGFLSVKKGDEIFNVGMSNNHVVNRQPADKEWDSVDTTVSIASPADGDNIYIKKLRKGPPTTLAIEFPKDHPGARDEIQKSWTAAQDLKTKDSALNYPTIVGVLKCLEGAGPKAADAKKCTIREPLLELYKAEKGQPSLMQRFVAVAKHMKLWSDRLAEVTKFDRTIDTVAFASGLRLTDEDPRTFLDWALVKMSNEQHGLSDCKALRQLADEITPGSPLAESAPIKEFRKLQANSIVFKVGGRTGPTAGKVAQTREIVNAKSDTALWQKHLGGMNNPFKDVTETFERRISKVKKGDAGKVVADTDDVFGDHGDSGSWIVDTNARVVGLLWAGDARHCFATDMSSVMESVMKVCGFDGIEVSPVPKDVTFTAIPK